MATRKYRQKKGTLRKKMRFNKRALLKRYPKLMKKLLGKNRLGGNELERLKIVSKLAINLLFDNANNTDLVQLKDKLLSEETDVDTLIERVFMQSNLKVESPSEFSKNILSKILGIYLYNLTKDVLRDYNQQLRDIIKNINESEKNATRHKKKDDRELQTISRLQERQDNKELRELEKLSKLSLSSK